MSPVIHKVFAYITHRNRLLVFRHTDFPEAGIQVPAGTVLPNEDLEVAVLREAAEDNSRSRIYAAAIRGTDGVRGSGKALNLFRTCD